MYEKIIVEQKSLPNSQHADHEKNVKHAHKFMFNVLSTMSKGMSLSLQKDCMYVSFNPPRDLDLKYPDCVTWSSPISLNQSAYGFELELQRHFNLIKRKAVEVINEPQWCQESF